MLRCNCLDDMTVTYSRLPYMIVLKINKYFYICFIVPIARNKQYCSVTGQEGKGRSGFPDRPVVRVHLNTFFRSRDLR